MTFDEILEDFEEVQGYATVLQSVAGGHGDDPNTEDGFYVFGESRDWKLGFNRYAKPWTGGKRGRRRPGMAEPTPRKLTVEQAAAIKADSRSLRKLAAEYGVSVNTIKRVKDGKRYREA